jgi:HEAT repeat protein
MKRRTLFSLLALVAVVAFGWAWFLDPAGRLPGTLLGEPFYDGSSRSAWTKRLSDGPDNDRSAAVTALAAGKADAVPVLRSILLHPESEAKWRAADALGRIGEPAALPAVPDLCRNLDDADPLVVDVAAQTLGLLGAPAAAEAVPALVREFPNIECIRAVAKFGPAGQLATDPLRMLLTHESAIVRWNALRTLGKIRAIATQPDVVRALADSNPEVREHAAEALGDFGPAAITAGAELEKALADPAPRVRRDAVTSFGKFGPAAKAYLPAVQRLKDDAHAEVKAAAVRAERLIDPTLAK